MSFACDHLSTCTSISASAVFSSTEREKVLGRSMSLLSPKWIEMADPSFSAKPLSCSTSDGGPGLQNYGHSYARVPYSLHCLLSICGRVRVYFTIIELLKKVSTKYGNTIQKSSLAAFMCRKAGMYLCTGSSKASFPSWKAANSCNIRNRSKMVQRCTSKTPKQSRISNENLNTATACHSPCILADR